MKNLPMCTKRLIVPILTAMLLCGIAAADTIVVTGVDTSRGEYNVWINENGQDVNAYYAGVILIQLADSGGIYNRDTLCVQLFTDINISQTYATSIVFPNEIGGGPLDQTSWLISNALIPGQNGGSTPSSLPNADWVTTAAQGAGLQLAIWDLVEDNGDGFSAGSVQQGSAAHPTDPAVLGWAEYYEAQALLQGHSNTTAFVYINVSLGNGNPAQMLEGPAFASDGGPQAQPEPATFVLAGTALVGLGLARRRKLVKLGNGSANL